MHGIYYRAKTGVYGQKRDSRREIDATKECIMEFRFKGPFITESDITGEKKADFATPNYATGMEVSKDRWLIIYDTVDARGCDFWRGIFCQIRAHQPDGEIINSGIIAPLETHHRPFGENYPCRKGYGNANILGCSLQNENSPAAGVFAISYNSRTELWYQGTLVQYSPDACIWPQDVRAEDWKQAIAEIGGLRMIKHYRFNPAKDDIDLIEGPVPSPGRQDDNIHHDLQGIVNWGNPVALNDDATAWFEVVRDPAIDSCLQTFRYDFDESSQTFRLTQKGNQKNENPEFIVGEPSLVR